MEKLQLGDGGNLKDVAKENQQTLIAAIRCGDEKVFEDFYRGYVDSLVKFLTKILRNEEDAKEITQDTFAFLWEHRETLNPHTSLKGFVAGTAKNMAFRFLRNRHAAGSHRDLQDNPSTLTDLADDDLIAKETEILIRYAIGNMPAQRRRIFELNREEGLTYHQIANRLSISHNTVKFHMQAALNDVRSVLAGITALVLLG